MCILAILCVVVYSTLESAQMLVFSNALNQAVEQNTLTTWLNIFDRGSVFINIFSKIMFYVALWCISTRFIKEN